MIFSKKQTNKIYIIVGIIYNGLNKSGWVSENTVKPFTTYRQAIKYIRTKEKEKEKYFKEFEINGKVEWKNEFQTLEITDDRENIENWVIYEKEI